MIKGENPVISNWMSRTHTDGFSIGDSGSSGEPSCREEKKNSGHILYATTPLHTQHRHAYHGPMTHTPMDPIHVTHPPVSAAVRRDCDVSASSLR